MKGLGVHIDVHTESWGYPEQRCHWLAVTDHKKVMLMMFMSLCTTHKSETQEYALQ